MKKTLQQNPDLEMLTKRDAYSIATALLYLVKDNKKYSTSSELFYLLDQENFIKLIKYYGGQEIRIPTIDEINDMLKVLLVYQYHIVEEIDWEESLKMSGYNVSESMSVRNKLQYLIKILKDRNFQDRSFV